MDPRLRRVAFCASLLIGPAAASDAQTKPPEAVRIERLSSLCKLWGSVKISHPFLAYRNLDWDAALVEAIPKVNAATTPEEFAAAIEGMLGALEDPATHVVAKSSVTPPASEQRDPTWSWTEDRILEVTIRDYADLDDYEGSSEKLAEVGKEVVNARGVLFDLRSDAPVGSDSSGAISYVFGTSGLQRALSSNPLSTPGQRWRMHVGFVPQEGQTSGGYYSAFSVLDGEMLAGDPNAGRRPVAFLINEWSELPPVAVALQSAGNGFLVSDGKASDASLIFTRRIHLADDVEVRVRVSELVHEDGSSGLPLDAEVPRDSGEGDRAREVALDLLRRPHSGTVARTPLAPRAVLPPERAYPEMKFPPVEYRLLAAFRIWTFVEYFFPYKDLMGEDWDAVLKEFIPKMEEARDARDYALTVAEMVTHLHDSHAYIRSEALSEYFGVAPPPILTRMIEGVPIVVRVDRDAARGIAIGDEVLKVNGEDVRARFARYAKYIAASTPQALNRSLQGRLMNGPEGSTATLTVRSGANPERTVRLPRKAQFRQSIDSWRDGEVFRILPGNIGYADLERLSVPMVDAMFEKFRNTEAIIFDMRGYPQGTAWSIAPRLTERTSVPAARFERTVLLELGDEGVGIPRRVTRDAFVQRLPPTSKWRYKGKTVMLIDERTVSQAEHTGLFFEAANGTNFVGSPTTGANGDVTNFLVPGGIRIGFTGQSVRHADGRQLQRIGLVPDIEVKPTIAGIRAGRDEVLERAIACIQDGSCHNRVDGALGPTP